VRSNFTGKLLYSRLVRIGFGGGLMTWKTSIGRLVAAAGVVGALALATGADAWWNLFLAWFSTLG